MRALAEFVMRGRAQAALVALFGSLLPLVSPAVVALVTLRRGLLEGFGIFLWALLPVLVPLALYGNSQDGSSNALMDLLHIATVGVVIITLLTAVVLRLTISWQQTLIATTIFGLIAAYMMELFFTADVLAVVSFIGEQLALVEVGQAAQGVQSDTPLVAPDKGTILAYVALVSSTSALGSLLLGRWWQSLLYNPGGFQIEMHQLRLNTTSALLISVPIVCVFVISGIHSIWVNVLALPFLLCTVGLVHWLVKFRQLGANTLIIFYLVMIVVFPIKVIMAVAVLDSIFDFRRRLFLADSGKQD